MAGGDQAADALSKRELEVASAYASGDSYKEIARSLGLSPTTVRTHLRSVYTKLGVTSKIELARFLEGDPVPDHAAGQSEVNADLALELDDAIRRERSLAKVLKIISQQPGDLEAVIDAVLDHALEICEAEFGVLFEFLDDGRAREMQSRNIEPAFAEWFAQTGPFELDSETAIGRMATSRQTVNITDVRGEDVYKTGSPLRIATAELGKARSFAAIPMMIGERLIGAFTVYRTRVHPFNDRALELAHVFADQSAIAIENARQFRDIQAQLDREAVNREILHLISQNRNDDDPVFDFILENAARLCGSPMARLEIVDEGRETFRCVAAWGEEMRSFRIDEAMPLHLPNDLPTALREGVVRHIPDLSKTELYLSGDPIRARMVEDEGYRTYLVVPLISNGQGIGGIVLSRREVAPFSDSDIALLENFAAQAVIAIENVRQFKALEARTEEVQTLNASLEARVEDQVGEIERMGKLKRFLPAAVADTVVSQGAEATLKSHRALLGVLFCDIRGFTAFCETAEPEETIEVLQTYHEEMGKLINAHGAGVDHRMGDGIMVLFNDPLPCDDPAGDAVRLAIAMRTRMRDLSKNWKRLGFRLGFGVGVSLGYATVGMVGFEGRFDYTASGTAVNLASRLCDEADDGEILLSPRAGIAVEDDFAIESRGEVTFKGIREPIEIFRLEG